MTLAFTPSDSLVGPVVDGLITVASQIAGLTRHYREAPEGVPDDNSVLYPLKGFEVVDATNGKLTFKLKFQVIHNFRRRRLQDNLANIHMYIPAWMDALSAWANQPLGGLATEVSLTDGQIRESTWGGQSGLALVLDVEVLTERAIPLGS